MRYVVGIRTIDKKDGPSIAIALTWFNSAPPFSVHGMSLKFMRRRLLATVKTQNATAELAINAALQRSAEKLYLKQLIPNPVNGDPAFSIILQPKNQHCEVCYPFKIQKKHWLLTGAKRAYDTWPGGLDG